VSIRKCIALVTLTTGLGGIGLAMANLSTVVGATSDAGVGTVCINKTVCPPGGPVSVGPVSALK
jgi:hypothetical protein